MSRLDDIQRRRDRRGLPSRPQPLIHAQLGQTPGSIPALPPATVGDVKAQSVRLADMLVFGPMMLYAGLGKTTPKWVKFGMVVIGAGTIIYNLLNYLEVSRRKRAAGIVIEGDSVTDAIPAGLSGMEAGPMHKTDPRFHRVINLLDRVA